MIERTYTKRVPTMACRQVTMDPGEEVQLEGTGRKMFVPFDWWIVRNVQTGHVDSLPPHQFEQVYREAPPSRLEVKQLVTAVMDAHLRMSHDVKTLHSSDPPVYGHPIEQ